MVKKVSFLANSLLLSLVFFAGRVFATEEGEQITIPQPDILPDDFEAATVISGLISLVIILSFLAAFFYLLWGGFQWITSGGDEAAVGAARNRITQALVGLIIVVAVWALFQLVEQFLGVTVFGEGGFTVPVITGGGTNSVGGGRLAE